MSTGSRGFVSQGEHAKGNKDFITNYVRLSRVQGVEGHSTKILDKVILLDNPVHDLPFFFLINSQQHERLVVQR